MSVHPKRDVGGNVALVGGPDPFVAAGTQNGAAINRLSYGNAQSCVLFAQAGAASGSPTSKTFDVKIQDSSDGSTGWADVSGAAVTQITADSAEGYKDVDLSAAKQYIRVVAVMALSGGSSPEWPVSCSVVLGGADTLPLA